MRYVDKRIESNYEEMRVAREACPMLHNDTRDQDLLHSLSALFGVAFEDALFGALLAYARLVDVWNTRMNLVGVQTAEALMDVLFADAFALSKMATLLGARSIVDVGSGAGAPALPLALLAPHAEMELVEPLTKRVAFLNTAVGSLGLGGRVRVSCARFEQRFKSSPAPSFDLAMSRATFDKARWLHLGATVGRHVVVFASEKEGVLVPSDMELSEEKSYPWPFTKSERWLMAYRKKAS